MAQTPVRFKRVAAAFNEAARARLCESSGSEHYFTDNSADLSDLINSFMERDFGSYRGDPQIDHSENDSRQRKRDDSDDYCPQSQTMDVLENLFSGNGEEEEDDDDVAVRKNLLAEAELACGNITGDRSSEAFKRRLMSTLRDRDFDAGLCKSRWEKFGRHPAGSYDYVDVNVKGNRYIVEAFPAGEFEIARPTSQYTELLDVFPRVFVGKPEKLKQVVRLMCNAMRESMKSNGMHVPPWRRNGYMQAKWFSQYKRTVNEVPTRSGSQSQSGEASAAKRAVGFQALPLRAYNCKEDLVSKSGFKVGYLTEAFHSSGIGM